MKHTYIEVRDIGSRVWCDDCGEEYTDRPDEGGLLFESKAYCPKCAAENLPTIKSYHEEHFIRAWCPKGMSFAAWCLSLRNGNNTIKITTIKEEP